MKHKNYDYRSLSKLTFSIGSILLIVGLLLGMFPQPVGATVAPEWDKSSLKFESGCTGNCEVVKAKICNTGSGDMAGSTTYKVYWAASGNPKVGVVVASGSIPALKSGQCTDLTYDPKTNPNGSAGNYMFKAYQRPGHPGTGELWSDQCSVGQCNLPTATPITPTATPVVTETPSPTPTDQPTDTPEPSDTPTATPVVTETPKPTEEPTKTETPPTKTVTPVGTDDPGSPTPEITETVVTTPQPTSSGQDEERDSQPPATLAPPSGSNTSLLIPVTGGDLSQPKPFGAASLLLINFGLALLGFGLILNGLGRR